MVLQMGDRMAIPFSG